MIEVEPPRGRRVGPFLERERGPEGSLFWWAYARNKCGIVVDPDTADGRAMLLRLACTAHFVSVRRTASNSAAVGNVER